MVKCPFCQYQNEDGALFCEQCKSDLSAVPAAAAPETMPMAALAEAAPVLEAAPFLEAEPVMAAPVEAAPVEAAPAAAAPAGAKLPDGAQPRLVVLRGLKINVEYPIYEGQNYIGRADEKPVDIDLDDQEPPDRVWSSRQHALIIYDNGELSLEDLNSAQRHLCQPDPRLPRPETLAGSQRRRPGRHRADEAEGMTSLALRGRHGRGASLRSRSLHGGSAGKRSRGHSNAVARPYVIIGERGR